MKEQSATKKLAEGVFQGIVLVAALASILFLFAIIISIFYQGAPVFAKVGKHNVEIIVHKDNPVTTVSRKTIQKIYTGEINNWKEIGGNDAPITVYSRPVDAGSFYTTFSEKIFKISKPLREDALFAENDIEMKTAITGDPNAIGCVNLPDSKALWENLKKEVGTVTIREFNIFFGVIGFLTHTGWHPTHGPKEFGILTLISGSFFITLITLIIALPLGLGTAIYISEIANSKVKEILKPFVELLAGIPSVIYGLFGMAFLGPVVRETFGVSTGLNILTSSIILSIMVVPIISSISEDAINSVPKNLREASLGVGANEWETIMNVVVPAAKSGIVSSVILGFGRAIGETMVLVMVAGGSAQLPKSIFSPVRPMTAAIAAEMGEAAANGSHFQALFAIGIVLFIITFGSNMITEMVRSNVKNSLKKQSKPKAVPATGKTV